ncbi:MAG: signal peptide peptidase SppA [Defluviitaleaceae bacterium]|nr:signal peptide peptidase SppA [Defluviitaleaceae bacterium]
MDEQNAQPTPPIAEPRKVPYCPPPSPNGFRVAMENATAFVNLMKSVLKVGLLFIFLFFLVVIVATGDVNIPAGESFSVIKIEGIIFNERGFGEGGYDHDATIQYIQKLADNPDNKGILLYMNTPGGTIYHSDEMYFALMDYKQETGRPVHAYMSTVCASGGVYISMAADYITAGRTSMTGSIGVVMTVYDTEELFEKLGIRTVAIDSGEHKSAGAMGLEITTQQEAVFQSIIDENFNTFVELIVAGRNLDEQVVRGFADGRLLAPRQALDIGLIDEVGTWDKALSDFEALTGVSAYYPSLSSYSFMGSFFSQASSIFPRSETEIALSELRRFPSGVPLVVAPDFID